MCQCGLAHPSAVFPGFDAGAQAFFVARSITVHRGPKFVPIDGAVVVVLALFVPFQIGVGQAHAQNLGLRNGGVNKTLAQVVVADALDAPALALR